jgi:hypothetical protein
MSQHVVVKMHGAGYPLSVIGPFDTDEEAAAWREKRRPGNDHLYEVVPLVSLKALKKPKGIAEGFPSGMAKHGGPIPKAAEKAFAEFGRMVSGILKKSGRRKRK